jgi:FKBP-type peptidyl-prolyl cis-trans isomerase FkpA
MTYLKTPFALALVAVALVGCSKPEPYPISEQLPAEQRDQMGYALGASVGDFVHSNLASQEESGYVVDRNAVIAGFVDTLRSSGKMDRETRQQLLEAMQDEFTSHRNDTLGASAQADGTAFLEANAAVEGVVTTESGLQYEVIEQGPADAPKPTAEDIVEVHYEGRLVTGEIFDSSLDRGEPLVIPLNRVIKGWTEGVQLMSVGSTYQFVIPAELGYGARMAGSIPPNSTLIFDVQLLQIIQQETADQAEIEIDGNN